MKPRSLPELILGERIVLRKHRLDMASAMFKMVDSNREHLGQHLPWVPWMKGIQDQRDYIESAISRWEDFNLFDFGIFLNEGQVYIGNIGAHTINWEHEVCEIGYWLAKNQEGKGYMSEALQVLERELFGIGLFRIEIHCSGSNPRSAEVARRNNYTQEAHLRGHRVVRGERQDTLIFSKLKNG